MERRTSSRVKSGTKTLGVGKKVPKETIKKVFCKSKKTSCDVVCNKAKSEEMMEVTQSAEVSDQKANMEDLPGASSPCEMPMEKAVDSSSPQSVSEVRRCGASTLLECSLSNAVVGDSEVSEAQTEGGSSGASAEEKDKMASASSSSEASGETLRTAAPAHCYTNNTETNTVEEVTSREARVKDSPAKHMAGLEALCGQLAVAVAEGALDGTEETRTGARYRIGQLYTISKHSHQESDRGEGVEVMENREHHDPVHGSGQYTEKRVHLSSKLPSWARAVVPRIFYICEKAWNYYPYTVTEYTCSFLPKFSIHIETRYSDDCGDNDSIFQQDDSEDTHEVSFVDIAFDEIPERYYKSVEDLRHFESSRTGRGPLKEGWRQHVRPVMCSYKLVNVKFEVWGLQTRVEHFVHKVIRDLLLVGHRQAFAWVDEWYGMTMMEVREYEKETQAATNEKIGPVAPTITISAEGHSPAIRSAPSTPVTGDPPEFLSLPKERTRKTSAPDTLTLPELRDRANGPSSHSAPSNTDS